MEGLFPCCNEIYHKMKDQVNSKTIIRSSQCSLKFSNSGKIRKIGEFIAEYRKIVQFFIDILWNSEKVPVLFSKDMTDKAETWLSARAVQAAAKQASGIVRGTKSKHQRRIYMVKKLNKEGKFKQARKLARIAEKAVMSKPNASSIQPELDARFARLEQKNSGTFDMWLTLTSLGGKMKVVAPLKSNIHFNEMKAAGTIKKGVRLGANKATFIFDLPKPPEKIEGKRLGIDIGMKKVFYASDGSFSTPDRHGWTLEKIQKRLCRRKKGGKGFERTVRHRANHIHWALNSLNLGGVKEIVLENIKHLRRGKRTSRKMSHWTYPAIRRKLESLAEESGVRISFVQPGYTSRRCSQCGWTCKANRQGEKFRCGKCGLSSDADLNASLNIALKLPPVARSKGSRPHPDKFYWPEAGQEPIVPAVLESLP